MNETGKSVIRRMYDSCFSNIFFTGDGIDIGAGTDSLSKYQHAFPNIKSLRSWDIIDGDAQFMESIPDQSYDFVHSSHCLEHLHNPLEGLANWFRILKPNGHMVILVPDEDLYEKGIFPSRFNSDHKWTFTIYKRLTWSEKSLNILELILELGDEAELIRIVKLDASFNYNLDEKTDQTTSVIGECAIEFVVRKRPEAELLKGGRY